MKISKTKHITKSGVVKRNPKSIKFRTIPMDFEWKQSLEIKLVGRRLKNPELVKLEKKLLTFGGEMVALQYEKDLDKILKRGIILNGLNPITNIGEKSSCHSNTCYLWDANQDRIIIMTGWALSRDGVWRQHTWGFDKKTKRVVETTENRVAYFGYKLNKSEMIKFFRENI